MEYAAGFTLSLAGPASRANLDWERTASILDGGPPPARRRRISARSLVVLINLELAVLYLPDVIEVRMLEVLPGVADGQCNWRVPRVDAAGTAGAAIRALQSHYCIGR
jgi:hypothetical protein